MHNLALLSVGSLVVSPLASLHPSHHRALAGMGTEGLDARYAAIAAALPAQRAAYAQWLRAGGLDQPAMQEMAEACGLSVDIEGGQVAYAADFEAKRVELAFDLLYCRHGKTTGNTEPRVYQGFVDEPNNALNEIGLG